MNDIQKRSLSFLLPFRQIPSFLWQLVNPLPRRLPQRIQFPITNTVTFRRHRITASPSTGYHNHMVAPFCHTDLFSPSVFPRTMYNNFRFFMVTQLSSLLSCVVLPVEEPPPLPVFCGHPRPQCSSSSRTDLPGLPAPFLLTELR